jgi:hypothetical protein
MVDILGYSRESFVGHVDDRYICPVCCEVLKNPRQCPVGHMYCDICLEKIMLAQSPKCPMCKCGLNNQNTGFNSLAKGFIDELISKCHVPEDDGDLHKDDACEWIGSLHLREAHVLVCQFRRPVTCPNAGFCGLGCARQYSRGALRIHLQGFAKARAHQLQALHKENEEQRNNDVDGFTVVKKKSRGLKVDIFCGEVKMLDPSIREGLGIQKTIGNMSESCSYVGEYVGGLRHGFGYFKSSKFVYNGAWENDLCHGECLAFVRKEDNMDRHGSGSFRNNVMHGMGKIWSKSSMFSYTGEFSKDKRHGHGTWVNGSGKKSFTGQFVDDKINGDGVMTFSNKTTLTGVFDGPWCFGEGTLRDQSGAVIYQGNFVRSEKHGKGVMYYANGECYDGEFKNDVKWGQGRLTFADKSVYNGRFYKDKCQGLGTVTSVDGVQGEVQEFYHGKVR